MIKYTQHLIVLKFNCKSNLSIIYLMILFKVKWHFYPHKLCFCLMRLMLFLPSLALLLSSQLFHMPAGEILSLIICTNFSWIICRSVTFCVCTTSYMAFFISSTHLSTQLSSVIINYKVKIVTIWLLDLFVI